MKELKNTKDSNNLFNFLMKYPNRWHGFLTDSRTKKAVQRVKKLWPSYIEVNWPTDQIRINISTSELIRAKEYAEKHRLKNPLKNYLGISKKKARRILHHHYVKGKPLTKKQYRFFGARASGYPYKNPKKERKIFFDRIQIDPFYSELIKKASIRLLHDLKRGSFNRRAWIHTLEAVVIRVAKEHNIKLSRIDKIRLALKIARAIWDKYVRR